MLPIVFVNCARFPFVSQIMAGEKLYETRNRDTLASLVGHRVLIAETGRGKPVVRCSARIAVSFSLDNRLAFDLFRHYTRVPEHSEYDWKESTKVKYLYELVSVRPVTPFIPAEGKRHGRVWMEYNGKKVMP